MSERGERFEALFDLDRLTPCEREAWDRYCAGPLGNEGPALRVWSLGQICMIECSGVPKVVAEYLEREDPENQIEQYLENVRAARRRRENSD